MKKVALLMDGAIVLVAIGPWLVWWSSLPDPVASHWDIHGHADGHLAPIALLLAFGGVAALLAAGAAASGRTESALPRLVSSAPVLAFVGGVLAVTSLASVLANRDAASWDAARLPLLWMIAAPVFGAAAAFGTARALPRPTAATNAAPPPSLTVGATERIAWMGRCSAPWIVVLAAALAVAGVVTTVLWPAPGGEIVLLSAVAVALSSSVHVVVGGKGVRVSAPPGWPTVTVPLERIESAEAIALSPMQWGGWGYRGSLRIFRRAAWIVRRGPGLKLNLHDGKMFVVTVDGADEAAASVNGLLAR